MQKRPSQRDQLGQAGGRKGTMHWRAQGKIKPERVWSKHTSSKLPSKQEHYLLMYKKDPFR